MLLGSIVEMANKLFETHGSTDQTSLQRGDAHGAQSLNLFQRLDAFGDYVDVDLSLIHI